MTTRIAARHRTLAPGGAFTRRRRAVRFNRTFNFPIAPVFLCLALFYATRSVWILLLAAPIMCLQMYYGFMYAATIAPLERRRRALRRYLPA
ncbi:MAG: hypothetical protein D6693_07250 [Planctomycetota bacterium]|nr:MAG: hypothetical protein D6693_07250 [Planctomycetota bacterium]